MNDEKNKTAQRPYQLGVLSRTFCELVFVHSNASSNIVVTFGSVDGCAGLWVEEEKRKKKKSALAFHEQ